MFSYMYCEFCVCRDEVRYRSFSSVSACLFWDLLFRHVPRLGLHFSLARKVSIECECVQCFKWCAAVVVRSRLALLNCLFSSTCDILRFPYLYSYACTLMFEVAMLSESNMASDSTHPSKHRRIAKEPLSLRWRACSIRQTGCAFQDDTTSSNWSDLGGENLILVLLSDECTDGWFPCACSCICIIRPFVLMTKLTQLSEMFLKITRSTLCLNKW